MNARVFIFLACLFFISCRNETPIKTKTPLPLVHDYSDSIEKGNRTTSPSEAEPEKKTPPNVYEGIRDLWQAPLKVIHEMGDLKGKTVADLGAGPYGYFTVQLAAKSEASKILALDIDPVAIKYIEDVKKAAPGDIGAKIETRLVQPDDPLLKKGEVDVVLVVNTAPYFDDRVAYFRNLLYGLADDGKVMVIDYKKRYTQGAGPPLDRRVSLGDMEADLQAAGYKNIKVNDRMLDYQYIIIARK